MYSQPNNKNFDKLQNILDLLKKQGATASEAIFAESSSVSVNRRLGKAESLTRDEGQVIGLRVFVDKKSAIVSSSDTSENALSTMAEKALAMARAVPEDKFSGIADVEQTAKNIRDLELYDKSEITIEQMMQYADETEQAALNVKGVTNSDGSSFDFEKGRVYYAASNGFKGSYATSEFSVSVSVIAGAAENMQTDYDFDSRAFLCDMRSYSEIGQSAGERAVSALNPRKPITKKMPIIFDNRTSGTMVRAFAAAISGASVVRGTTLLKNCMNERIFPEGINIIDDPFMARGTRSHPFDGEGISPQKRNIIENGVLQGWFLDLRSARQLGLESTGNAVRGVSAPPSPKASNLYMQAGKISLQEMIKDIKEGLFITELMGSGADIVTGDYSQGARGFMIENGVIAYPVAEMTIAGNLRDMWLNCEPADDLELRYGVDAPSIRVDGLTVAGS